MIKNIAVYATNVTKDFMIDKNKKISVLKGISLSASYGEFISILGISGSGKSTLLSCLSSLSRPTSGEILINDVNPYSLKDSKLALFRRNDIAVIFQNYNLVPALPVLENITLPLRLSGKKIADDQIKSLLKSLNFEVEITAKVANLSGGEQQKVAIARAILTDSKVIFADEPTGALDSISRQLIFEALKNLAINGKCVLMVTHDIELASMTDKSLILKDGRISKVIHKPTAEKLYQALETINE